MKKGIYIFISLFCFIASSMAEKSVVDTMEVKEIEKPKNIYCWTYSDDIGTEIEGGIDTSMNNFHVLY